MKTKKEFPFKKGDKAYVVSEEGRLLHLKVESVSPTMQSVRLATLHYFRKTSGTPVDLVGRTPQEAFLKRFIKASYSLDWKVRRNEREAKDLTRAIKKLDRLRTKCLKRLT